MYTLYLYLILRLNNSTDPSSILPKFVFSCSRESRNAKFKPYYNTPYCRATNSTSIIAEANVI